MKDLSTIRQALNSPKKIVITTHANPDADALGSSLALYGYLNKKGHAVTVISPTDYPEFLFWMPGNEEVVVNNPANKASIQKTIATADVIFCLDFNGLDRIKDLGKMVSDSAAKKVLIDHHLNPQPFADYEFWNTKAAATAELVFDFIVDMGDKAEIDRPIAECIYAGIMTDTGSFRHPSTTAKVHRIVADLIDLGINVNSVSRNIYDNNSVNRLKFIGFALSEKLTVDETNHIGYFVITKEDQKRFDLKPGDTEGLVNYALSINGVKVAAIIMEKEDEVKMSFRSVENYAVNDFAAAHFNGGGHKNAAGGHSTESLSTVVTKFKNLVSFFENQD